VTHSENDVFVNNLPTCSETLDPRAKPEVLDAAREAGYSESVARKPKIIWESPAVLEAWNRSLTFSATSLTSR
jgi:hypothetical protein